MNHKLEEILFNLISFKTFEGNSNKASEVSRLYGFAKNLLGDKYQYKYYTSNGHESIIIYTGELENCEIILQSHIDVVPASDEQFSAIVEDNRIYGRGASDMKFAAAIYLKVFAEENVDNKVAIWLTSDEEIGGFDGVNYLLKEIGLRPKFCLLPDGSNNDAIVKKAKGVTFFTIETKGKSSHGSMPWLGANAIDRLFEIYQKINNHKVFERNGDWFNTLNFGKVEGGTSNNVVPNYAKGYFDCRFIKNEIKEELFDYIKSILGPEDILKETIFGYAYHLDENSKYYVNFKKALESSGTNYKFDSDNGSSDARFFVEYNIPVILYKPICGGDHSEKEWIDIDSLNQFYETVKIFVKQTPKLESL